MASTFFIEKKVDKNSRAHNLCHPLTTRSRKMYELASLKQHTFYSSLSRMGPDTNHNAQWDSPRISDT